jgi:hypothetical protein
VEAGACNITCCDKPDGYLLDDGVSGTELRDGESSGFRRVWSWRPMVAETADESSACVRSWSSRACHGLC